MVTTRSSSRSRPSPMEEQSETIVVGKVSQRGSKAKASAAKSDEYVCDTTKPSPVDKSGWPSLTSKQYRQSNPRRQPTATPPFTLEQLRNEIADLFVRPLWKSLGYVALNLFFVIGWFILHLFLMKGALSTAAFAGNAFGWDLSELSQFEAQWIPYTGATTNLQQFIPQSFNALLQAPFCAALSSPVLAIYTTILALGTWNYIYWQAHFFTGLLIIAHECGHKALFNQIWLGHIFGWIFHSFLFIPYFSWSFTHRTHHTYNKNQSYDEVHMMAHIDDAFPSVSRPFGADYHPKVHAQREKLGTTKKIAPFFTSFKALVKEMNDNLLEFSAPYRAFYYVLYFTIGFPLYLLMNAGGRKYPAATLPPNHFDPNSPVFHKGEGIYVMISNLGLILNCLWIYYAWQWSTAMFVACAYSIPALITHFYFVMYTLGHHSHPGLPSYSGEKWNYLQGALSTIDRSHGPVVDYLWHYISRTHVIHHIFSDLPFYNSWEATERLKPILGDYYMFTDEDNRWFGTLISLWSHIRDQTFVAEDDHPGLVLIATAFETAQEQNLPLEHPIVEKAVQAKVSEALENNPHKNGRNIDAEVFWPRTLQL